MIAAIDQFAGWVTVAAGVITLTVLIGFTKTGPVALLMARAGRRLPEYGWWYDAATIDDYLRRADRDLGNQAYCGRRMYRLQLGWDLVLALVYGIGLAIVIDGTWGRALHRSHWRLIGLAPLAALVLVDWIEDLLLRWGVGAPSAGDGSVHPGAIAVARWFTAAKRILAVVVLLVLLAGGLLIASSWPGTFFHR